MKTLVAAFVIVLLVSSTAFSGWYVAPTVVQAYYPAVPMYAAPVAVAPVPYATYMPVAVPAPVYSYAPVVGPTAVIVGRPAVIRARVFYPGQPVRNVVKAVVP